MNSRHSQKKSSSARRLGVVVAVVLAAFAWFAFNQWRAGSERQSAVAGTPDINTTNSVAANSASSTPRYAGFRERPLDFSRESNSHQWTDADGKSPDIIKQLAHNELEAGRMLKENETIFRRQLVYRKQTMSVTAQRAMQSGEPIRELFVPGLDGEEFQVEVRNMEIADGGANGTFSGNILGHPDSMVTMAFKNGREAFTVISIADQIYLTAEPREPGEVVVKKVDPDKYGGMDKPCTVN